MSYDRADYLGGFAEEAGLQAERAGLHIGFFIAWAINRDLISTCHLHESDQAVSSVKSRKLTGKRFLSEYCDEKLQQQDLNQLGNAFADDYYVPTYLDDFKELFGVDYEHSFQAGDTWENFDRISQKLDERFAQWKATTKQMEIKSTHGQRQEVPYLLRKYFVEHGPISISLSALIFVLFACTGWFLARNRWDWSVLPAIAISLLVGFAWTMLCQTMVARYLLKKYTVDSDYVQDEPIL